MAHWRSVLQARLVEEVEESVLVLKVRSSLLMSHLLMSTDQTVSTRRAEQRC